MQIPSPIIFLRHGATPWNERGRYQGIKDIPLAAAGFEDARKNAGLIEKLIREKALNPQKLSIVTSPLTRANETAKTIASSLNLPPPTVNSAFREVSVGHWQGLTSQEVKDKFYEERKRRKLDRWNFKPQGGESMRERSQVINTALPTLNPDTIIVTHSVVMRILWHILGKMPEQEAAQMHIPHVGVLYWDGKNLKNILQQE